MPIRPENKGRYPKEWPAIRSAILARAQNRCEKCGVPNHCEGARDQDGEFHAAEAISRMSDWTRLGLFGTKTPHMFRIILTIAHLDHTPEHNDPGNLRAYCQRCHNVYDAQHRAKTRKGEAA